MGHDENEGSIVINLQKIDAPSNTKSASQRDTLNQNFDINSQPSPPAQKDIMINEVTNEGLKIAIPEFLGEQIQKNTDKLESQGFQVPVFDIANQMIMVNSLEK